MLTLQQLINISNPELFHRFGRYRLDAYDVSDTNHDSALAKQVAARVISKSPHNTNIKILGQELHITNPAMVQCDCKHFVHVYEMANVARQASILSRSTGAYPRSTNADLKPGLCGHLLYVATIIASGNTERAKLAGIDKKTVKAAMPISDALKNLTRK